MCKHLSLVICAPLPLSYSVHLSFWKCSPTEGTEKGPSVLPRYHLWVFFFLDKLTWKFMFESEIETIGKRQETKVLEEEEE